MISCFLVILDVTVGASLIEFLFAGCDIFMYDISHIAFYFSGKKKKKKKVRMPTNGMVILFFCLCLALHESFENWVSFKVSGGEGPSY